MDHAGSSLSVFAYMHTSTLYFLPQLNKTKCNLHYTETDMVVGVRCAVGIFNRCVFLLDMFSHCTVSDCRCSYSLCLAKNMLKVFPCLDSGGPLVVPIYCWMKQKRGD